MQTNITVLRKQAYKSWGLSGRKVIFNFPKMLEPSDREFYFRFNFSPSMHQWPRTYAIAMGDQLPIIRIIAPIFLIRKYASFQTIIPAWYDMPFNLHEQILSMLNEPKERHLTKWQKICNRIKANTYSTTKSIEEYTYGISLQNDNLVARIF